MTILAYVNSVSPSCVYFITLHRLHQQTCAESEHSNQNQKKPKYIQSSKIVCKKADIFSSSGHAVTLTLTLAEVMFI